MIKHPLPDRTDVCIASEASLDLDAARSLLGVLARGDRYAVTASVEVVVSSYFNQAPPPAPYDVRQSVRRLGALPSAVNGSSNDLWGVWTPPPQQVAPALGGSGPPPSRWRQLLGGLEPPPQQVASALGGLSHIVLERARSDRYTVTASDGPAIRRPRDPLGAIS